MHDSRGAPLRSLLPAWYHLAQSVLKRYLPKASVSGIPQNVASGTKFQGLKSWVQAPISYAVLMAQMLGTAGAVMPPLQAQTLSNVGTVSHCEDEMIMQVKHLAPSLALANVQRQLL